VNLISHKVMIFNQLT